MQIGKRNFNLEKDIVVVGIINTTPDSFSGDGISGNIPKSIKIAKNYIDSGVGIIDIGGESTRPKNLYDDVMPISVQQEIDLTIPVIEAIKNNFDIPISIDTRNSEVATSALIAGADMINDVSMLNHDPKMINIIKSTNKPYVLTHNKVIKSNLKVSEQVVNDLDLSVNFLLEAGIDKKRLILDPGFGFGKNFEQNIELHQNFEIINKIGLPIMVGTSRKSFLGKINLNKSMSADKRNIESLASALISKIKGANFIRVHDVDSTCRFLNAIEKLNS